MLKFHYLLKLLAVAYLLVAPICYHLPLLHDDDLVGPVQILHSVGGHDDRLVPQVLQDGLLHQELAHVHVHCAQDVVQQVDVLVRVERPGQTDPRLLASRQVHSFLSDLGVDAFVQYLQIIL